ncbi:hypothetical protein ONZ45_g5076 [Pleurotus djamor]|nr:hypothetical protein ONZ45_g5076 [Pleurotus djamor]
MAKRRVIITDSDLGSSDEDFEPETKPKKNARKRVKRSEPAMPKPAKSPSSGVHYPPHGVTLHQIDFAGEICRPLLEWYHGVSTSRGMPWRKPYDPSLDKNARSQRAYEVWISEIMLQQTQVATVIPYYNRWMDKFPTIRHLASSSIDEVNSLWKGLGYYSRASRLLAGAQAVVNDMEGIMPPNAKEMEAKIPGVGRYSSGAICSIAYGEAVPVLDGNVHRLLSRFLALHAQPKAKATLEILWSAAQAIVCGVKPPSEEAIGHSTSTLHQDTAGARRPEDPAIGYKTPFAKYVRYEIAQPRGQTSSQIPDIEELCSVCEPLMLGGGVSSFPMKVERKKAREELDLVSVVEWCSETQQRVFLLVKRPENGLLAGLHEFPTSANVPTPVSQATSAEITNSLLSTSVYHIVDVKPAGEVVHVFSHIKKTYRVQWVRLGGCDRPPMVVSSFADEPTSTKGSSKRRNASPSKPSQLPGAAVWLEMDQVLEANISTGVRKVWDLVSKLWK